jgi:L-2-hydroxyglutarate oxidase LhgO
MVLEAVAEMGTGISSRNSEAFYAEVRKYWPALPDEALQAGYAGMRPKINGPQATTSDFLIQGPTEHGVPDLVNLFGIEPPGLTSALAIGDHVCTPLFPQRQLDLLFK